MFIKLFLAKCRLSLLVVVMAIASVALPAHAVEELKRFYGEFEGVAFADDEKGEKRTIRLKVEPTSDQSFHVTWVTIIKKSDGREKESKTSVEFRSSERDQIFSSAMRKNLFGKWEPLNPMQGDPYIWAKTQGDDLIIYVMVITEDGGYEMQQYNRRIRSDGSMDLEFYRIRNGVKMKTIEGILDRVN